MASASEHHRPKINNGNCFVYRLVWDIRKVYF